MSVFFGTTSIGKIFAGSTEVERVYLGTTQVYSSLVISLPTSLESPFVVRIFDGTPKFAGFRFNTDGTIESNDIEGQAYQPYANNWATPTTTGVGSGYEIRCDTVDGTLSTGTANTWLSLSSARAFTIARTSEGYTSYTGTITIRESGGANVASAPIFLEVEIFPGG